MKSLIVAVLVAAFAFTLSAQGKKAPGEHSMTGCLQKGSAPNSYMLDNVEGNGPKTIGEVSSAANLAPHVGPKIEVTDVAVPATDAQLDKSAPQAPHHTTPSGINICLT